MIMRAFLLEESEIRLVEAFRKMQPRYAEICWTTIAIALSRNAESIQLKPAEGLELAAINARPRRRRSRARAALEVVK
jgi:hypothetical protein